MLKVNENLNSTIRCKSSLKLAKKHQNTNQISPLASRGKINTPAHFFPLSTLRMLLVQWVGSIRKEVRYNQAKSTGQLKFYRDKNDIKITFDSILKVSRDLQFLNFWYNMEFACCFNFALYKRAFSKRRLQEGSLN